MKLHEDVKFDIKEDTKFLQKLFRDLDSTYKLFRDYTRYQQPHGLPCGQKTNGIFNDYQKAKRRYEFHYKRLDKKYSGARTLVVGVMKELAEKIR